MTTPIFILGVAPRCGTNYLEDLLCVHPDCGLGIPLRENQLMSGLAELADVVDRYRAGWGKLTRWGFQPEHADDLAESIGRGLIDFMVSQVDARRRLSSPPETLPGIEAAFKLNPTYLISKHPRAVGLAHFRSFFPNEKLILFMRDGRAVAESSVRSWGWHLDVAIDGWRQGAGQMRSFLDANPDDSALFVRYEDLLTAPEEELGRIFGFIGLDTATFDWETALQRPVRGSSTARPVGATRVDWKPVEKTEGFDPLARAQEWTEAEHRRFNHLAGELSVHFGYPLVPTEQGPVAAMGELGRDALLQARNLARPLRRRIGIG